MTKAIADGNDHSPASSGDRPDTSLGDEQEVADGDEDGQEVHSQRGVERTDPEQAEVDHRVVQSLLAADPQRGDRQAGHDRHDWSRRKAGLRKVLQAEDARQDGSHRHRRADNVQSAGVRVAVLREHTRTEDEQGRHDRQRE